LFQVTGKSEKIHKAGELGREKSLDGLLNRTIALIEDLECIRDISMAPPSLGKERERV
jgi:hypothetical protein